MLVVCLQHLAKGCSRDWTEKVVDLLYRRNGFGERNATVVFFGGDPAEEDSNNNSVSMNGRFLAFTLRK